MEILGKVHFCRIKTEVSQLQASQLSSKLKTLLQRFLNHWFYFLLQVQPLKV